MENIDGEKFNISDFYIAAYFVAKGIRLLGVDRENPRRVLFIFKDFEDRPKLTEDFLLGNGLVNPKCYVSAIKELKDLIYTQI